VAKKKNREKTQVPDWFFRIKKTLVGIDRCGRKRNIWPTLPLAKRRGQKEERPWRGRKNRKVGEGGTPRSVWKGDFFCGRETRKPSPKSRSGSTKKEKKPPAYSMAKKKELPWKIKK